MIRIKAINSDTHAVYNVDYGILKIIQGKLIKDEKCIERRYIKLTEQEFTNYINELKNGDRFKEI